MGGNALVPGNATPVAEANIEDDPEAADIVFGADWPTTMVGLDVTHKVCLSGAALAGIFTEDSGGLDLLRSVVPFYQDFLKRLIGLDGIYLHDPAAVAFAIDSSAFGTEQWPIRVETEGISRGKTWPAVGGTDDPIPEAWRDRPNVSVCTDVDATHVLSLVESLLLASE